MAGIRYGIDVDETLLALLPSLIQFNNEVHGTKIRLEDFTILPISKIYSQFPELQKG